MDVTLIVTTHNRATWLAECLKSIRISARGFSSQTVVVDDSCSPNVTRRIAGRGKARYLQLPGHAGYSEARVAAYEQVETPYLAFIDDDDVLLPNWHRLHLETIHRGYDVVSSSYWETYPALKHKAEVTLQPVSLEGLLAGRVPVNDGSLIRRSVLDGVPWRPDRDKVMMMSMWLALASKGARFATIAEPTWLYRIHPAQMSAAPDEQDAAYRREAIAEWTPSQSS